VNGAAGTIVPPTDGGADATTDLLSAAQRDDNPRPDNNRVREAFFKAIQQVEATRIAPGLDDLSAHHGARRPAQVGGIELPKVKDVAAHEAMARLD